MLRPASLTLAALVTLVGCADDGDPSSQNQDVVLNTKTEQAWAQYEANLDYALSYQPTCVVDESEEGPRRPRVLVSGYGRFKSNPVNATGQIVSTLVPGLEYPMTERPPAGEVDLPEPQTAVALSTIDLPGVGLTDVCGMVIPVYWDLASVLVLKEVEAFNPDFVMMNGIAGYNQPLWLELGSVNRAMASTDGSNTLAPDAGAALIPTAPEADLLRGLLLSWEAVDAAAEQTIAAHAEVSVDGYAFGDILSGARFAGYPRPSNTYLCNNVAYTTSYLMDHGGESFRLLEPSDPREGRPDGIDMSLSRDHSQTPRVFVHWPSHLDGAHIETASDVMSSIIDAQLSALQNGDLPTRGDNERAEIAATTGAWY